MRHIGLSNESPWGTMRFLAESEAKGTPRVASIQNAYNLLNRTYETGLAEIGMREDVGLLAYSALGQGYLTGKYLDGARPAGARTTLFNRGQRYEKPGTDDAVRDYLAIAKEAGLDPATFAIAFTLDKPFLTSTIIGATTMEQLKIAIAAGHVRLPKESTRRSTPCTSCAATPLREACHGGRRSVGREDQAPCALPDLLEAERGGVPAFLLEALRRC